MRTHDVALFLHLLGVLTLVAGIAVASVAQASPVARAAPPRSRGFSAPPARASCSPRPEPCS